MARADRGDGRDAGDDPERPVVAPTFRNAVDVRARPHLGQFRLGAAQTPDHVAEPVALDLEAGFLHPLRDELARGPLGVAAGGPVRPAPASQRVEQREPFVHGARHRAIMPRVR